MEIRVPTQNEECVTLPSQSYLYIEVKLLTTDDNRSCNRGFFFLCDEIRFEWTRTVIARNRSPGIFSCPQIRIGSDSEYFRQEYASFSSENKNQPKQDHLKGATFHYLKHKN